METKSGFIKLTVSEFETWLFGLKLARTILKVQQHHTFIPSYIHFKNRNHFELQKGMKNHHVNQNGWENIGQHFTIFPDGTILTGRSLEKSPACIYGQNANAICIENLGNFDLGGDVMSVLQKDAIVTVTALLCKRFNLPVNSNSIVYHHWFNLNSGERNNGTKNNKSCPGTNFFGGNKVADCENIFLPLISAKLIKTPIKTDVTVIEKYAVVTAKTLNIRNKPSIDGVIISDRPAAIFGAILRVYQEKDGWLKISNSQEHWVLGKFTLTVKRAKVIADTLNVRSGANANFPKVGNFLKGEEVFIIKEQDDWCKISMDEKWVNKKFLSF